MSEDQVEVAVITLPKENQRALSVEEIIEIADEEEYRQVRDRFIEAKLADFKDTTKAKEFSVHSPPYKGFIHPDSEIKPISLLDGFKLDDTNIYSRLIDNVRAFKRDFRWKSKSIREINPYAVLKTLGEYFGNYTADEGLEGRHHSYYMDHSSADSEALPLVELKGKGLAMCTEKAAAAQNLVTLLGYDSELCLSQGCQLIDGKEEMHAFNVINSDRGRFIFEPANPIILTDTEGNIVNFYPATYRITDEQYAGLMSGGEVEIDHTDLRVSEGRYEKQGVEVRKYGGLGKITP